MVGDSPQHPPAPRVCYAGMNNKTNKPIAEPVAFFAQNINCDSGKPAFQGGGEVILNLRIARIWVITINISSNSSFFLRVNYRNDLSA